MVVFRLHCLSLQIYVVMEKMNGDMLEMILNSPSSRLTERVTKFMVYQVCNTIMYFFMIYSLSLDQYIVYYCTCVYN